MITISWPKSSKPFGAGWVGDSFWVIVTVPPTGLRTVETTGVAGLGPPPGSVVACPPGGTVASTVWVVAFGSTVQVRVAGVGSMLPAASVARASNVCDPAPRPE